MPGRIVRSTRASTNGATARSQTTKAGARNSSPATSIPDEGEDTSLRRSICSVFSDSQKHTAGHRKLVIKLRKIQEACCYEPVNVTKGQRAEEDFEEEDFNREVVRCILRILAVRKAETAGDRVVRFLGTYLNSATSKDLEIASQADPDATSLPDTPTSRLTSQILEELLLRLDAKDKTIRFRATQITSHIINSLDTLDDVLFYRLRLNLLKRIYDKEAPVRLQAVYGLGRLAAEIDEDHDGDSDSDNEVGTGVLQKLLSVLQNDPAPEVRRNLLLNLPLTKEVLPYLLERARDADGQTRRALYARLLPALGDFRHLSLTHREKLLRWGLRDRDENVRKATARLFRERWIEDCAALPAAQAAEQVEGEGTQQGQRQNTQAADPSLDALLELLERIDVVNSGVEGGIALVAMNEFWEGRPDYVDYVSFPDHFWEDLNPELGFVARTFNDYCRAPGSTSPPGLAAMAEEKLPELTKFGFYLEREMNKLIETINAAALGGDEAEEEAPQIEFIVEQLLHMALTFDYSDEVGRRKIFVLMREALALADLPEECTRLVVEVLRLVCGESVRGETEFCTVVLEAVAEVHDSIMGEDAGAQDNSSVEESFHSATSHFGEDGSQVKAKSKNRPRSSEATEVDNDKAIREIMVNMKCLHIALCMLQNVSCELEGNVHLVTMLNNLVVPAVRSQEAPIRERGLLCLGLCCLLGKNLAQENLTLFLHCFAKGHSALQAIALQIIADILVTHPSLLTESPGEHSEPNELKQQIIKTFGKSLKSDDPTVQSTGATALAKTMLSRLITDSGLLKQLVVVYFDPDTKSNAQLQQGLTYFLPVYCHSRAENAQLMAEIACPIITKLVTLRESLQDDADVEEDGGPGGVEDMATPTRIANMLIDWTDPRKIVGFTEAGGVVVPTAINGSVAAADVHYILAAQILERLTYNAVGRDEKKILFSMLGKLHLPPPLSSSSSSDTTAASEADLLKVVLTAVSEAIDSKVASDATSRNTLSKLRDQLLKLMNRVATEERGGGGAEETVIESTELAATSTMTGRERNIMDDFDEDAEDTNVEGDDNDTKHGNDLTQLQTTMNNITIGATTLGGGPDAEGTRVQLGLDEADADTEMMDVDGEEYTEVTEG